MRADLEAIGGGRRVDRIGRDVAVGIGSFEGIPDFRAEGLARYGGRAGRASGHREPGEGGAGVEAVEKPGSLHAHVVSNVGRDGIWAAHIRRVGEGGGPGDQHRIDEAYPVNRQRNRVVRSADRHPGHGFNVGGGEGHGMGRVPALLGERCEGDDVLSPLGRRGENGLVEIGAALVAHRIGLQVNAVAFAVALGKESQSVVRADVGRVAAGVEGAGEAGPAARGYGSGKRGAAGQPQVPVGEIGGHRAVGQVEVGRAGWVIEREPEAAARVGAIPEAVDLYHDERVEDVA